MTTVAAHGLTLQTHKVASYTYAKIYRLDGQPVGRGTTNRPIAKLRPLYSDFKNTVTEEMGHVFNSYKKGDDPTKLVIYLETLENLIKRHQI